MFVSFLLRDAADLAPALAWNQTVHVERHGWNGHGDTVSHSVWKFFPVRFHTVKPERDILVRNNFVPANLYYLLVYQVSFTFSAPVLLVILFFTGANKFHFDPGEGLRGPLVIYDPLDPYLDMYDVDDGQFQPLTACAVYTC